jgi:hypothetical protein
MAVVHNDEVVLLIIAVASRAQRPGSAGAMNETISPVSAER